MMSLTYAGVYTALIGTFLVNSLGISDACSGEITSKSIEYLPMIIGSVMSLVGRYRLGGVTALGGFRK